MKKDKVALLMYNVTVEEVGVMKKALDQHRKRKKEK